EGRNFNNRLHGTTPPLPAASAGENKNSPNGYAGTRTVARDIFSGSPSLRFPEGRPCSSSVVSSSQTIPPQTGLAGPVPPFRTGVSSPAMWRITREQVLLLGGPSAAILQIAHPTVALGVAHHSDFRADTLGRLRRTLDAIYT